MENYKHLIVRLTLVTLLITGIFGGRPVQAETISSGWAQSMGGAYLDYGSAVALDANGNVYSTGFVSSSLSNRDIFINKLDSSGNFLWSKFMGGPGSDASYAIEVDHAGNAIITGPYSDTVDFDPGTNTSNLTAVGSSDIFLSKFDTNGNFIWAKGLGSTSYDTGANVAVDASGHIFLTGMYSDTMDADPGPGINNLNSAGERDVFLSKFDAGGNLLWAKSIGGISDDAAYGIAIDGSGSAFISGYFTGTVDFDPGLGTQSLTSVGGTDIFISKFDRDGNFVWATPISAGGSDNAIEIAVDGWGDIYATGYAGIGGSYDIFLGKLEGSGNILWARNIGGDSHDTGYGIAVDTSGYVYFTGGFNSTVDFGPGTSLTSAGASDIFINKIDRNGNLVWAKRLGGPSSDLPDGIAVDGTGNVYVNGSYYDTADFDPGPDTNNLTSAGDGDAFITKLNLSPHIYYVKWNATGANDGTSWANAFTDLQSALSAASSGDEIWVAAGTYKPTSGTDRTASFHLKSGVSVYGGFAGTETSHTFLNFETNATFLSGDIGVVGDNSDNSYHVVVGSNTNEYTKLDGFWVTAGNANGVSSPNDRGGGIYNDKGNLSLTNVLLMGNYATFGGGMYNRGEIGYPGGTAPQLTNVIFRENSAVEGGGMRNEDNSHPRLMNISFSGNTAVRSGGGMENFNYSNPMLTNVTFHSNSAAAGGGIMNWSNSSPNLTNVTFNANSATEQGGAIYNDNGSSPWMRYVTASGNNALQGGGIYNAYGSNPSLSSNIFYGNAGGQIYDVSGTKTVIYSIVQGGYTGTGNLDADPLLGPLQYNGGFTQTMALGTGSPAIDAGEAAYCPSTDQRDGLRPQGSGCDIGAYEYTAPTPTITFTPTNTLTLIPTATKTPTLTPTYTPTNTFTPTVTPPYSYNPLYLSLTGSQTIGGISSADEDILRFDGKNWSVFFDGSDVGVGSPDLSAFSIVDADTILMSFSANVTVSGISATPQDVLQFDATSLGSTTAGTWTLYFDGSDVGFDTSSENIDSLKLLPDGQLLFSTTGNPLISSLTTGRDEDVLMFTPTTLGNNTSGSWSMYFDGSDAGLGETNDEDIDALDVTTSGNIYLSTLGNFAVSGIAGTDEDVFVCAPTSVGDITACTYSPKLYFDGSTWGLASNDVDAFNFNAISLPPTVVPSVIPTITPTHNQTATTSPSPTATFTLTNTSTPPSSMFVQVAQPNGGEVLNAGSVYRITWNSTPDIDKVSIGYKSCDSCLNWIASNIPNNGYYDWTVFVGNTINTQFKIYVIGYDTGVGSISDVSDNDFTVLQPTPTPTFTATSTSTVTPTQIVLSPTPTATQTTGVSQLTFNPTADAYVDANNPANNYGMLNTLRVDGSPIIRSYLRFNVQGVNGTITRATLRVFANSASSSGIGVSGVNNDTWTETGINYNNAPPGNVLGSTGSIGAGTWINIDVTAFITEGGSYNLALTTPGSTAVSLASRESGANAPQLIIETAP